MVTAEKSLAVRDAMVRDASDCPVRLRAMKLINDNTIEVASLRGDASIGFPIEYVFEYDESLFQQLSIAATRKNRARIEALWRTAKPFDL